MASYLVVGLESSATKIVAILIALNLKIIRSAEDWSGDWSVQDDINQVTHRSLPHGDDKYYISSTEAGEYDYIVMVIRDWHCSLASKVATHQPDVGIAELEHMRGRQFLLDIFMEHQSKLQVFSYETAYILRKEYVKAFLRSIGIKDPRTIKIKDINKKYIGI